MQGIIVQCKAYYTIQTKTKFLQLPKWLWVGTWECITFDVAITCYRAAWWFKHSYTVTGVWGTFYVQHKLEFSSRSHPLCRDDRLSPCSKWNCTWRPESEQNKSKNTAASDTAFSVSFASHSYAQTSVHVNTRFDCKYMIVLSCAFSMMLTMLLVVWLQCQHQARSSLPPHMISLPTCNG